MSARLVIDNQRHALKRRNASSANTSTRRLGVCQLQEDALQRVDLRQVGPCIVLAATLAHGEAELALRICITRHTAAEMDDRSKILFLLPRGLLDAMALERLGDASVQ